MRSFRNRLVMAYCAFACAAACAEDSRAVRRLTLAEVLEEARVANLDVQWVRAKQGEATGILKVERADLLPELKGTVVQSRQDRSVGAYGLPETVELAVPDPLQADIQYNIPDRLVDQFGLPTEAQVTFPESTDVTVDYSETTGPYNWFDAKLRLSVPVFNGAEYREYRAATAGERQARLEITAAEEKAMNQAGELYFNFLLADARVTAASERLTLQEKRVAYYRDQVESGLATDLELRRELLAQSGLQAELNSARSSRDQVGRELAKLLNWPAGVRFEAADTLTFAPRPAPAPAEAYARALERRADYRSQKEQEAAARLKRDAARAESWPSLNAFGNYGYQGNRYDDTVEAWAIGAYLEIPIWDSQKRTGRLEQRASQYAQAVNRTEALEQGIRGQLEGLLDAQALAADAVAVARESVAVAEEHVRLKRDQVQAGLAKELDVLAAETELTKAQAGEREALCQYALARLRLCAAMGDVRDYVRGADSATESTTTPGPRKNGSTD